MTDLPVDEEIVDVVGEDNEVLSQVPKSEAHAKGLLHRTVIAEIKDSEGNWVLVKQASDRQDAGQYVSPVGGHARAGESEEDALKREAAEETGLTDFEFKLIGRIVYQREVLGRNENHYFVLFEIYSDGDITLNEESVHFQKLSEKELNKSCMTTPTSSVPHFS